MPSIQFVYRCEICGRYYHGRQSNIRICQKASCREADRKRYHKERRWKEKSESTGSMANGPYSIEQRDSTTGVGGGANATVETGLPSTPRT